MFILTSISYTSIHNVQDINITVHGQHICVTTNTCHVVPYSETINIDSKLPTPIICYKAFDTTRHECFKPCSHEVPLP